MSGPDEPPGSADAPFVIVGGGFSLFASALQIVVGVVATCIGVAFLFSGSVVPLPMVLLGIGALYLGLRTRRLRVVADRTGVTVRNPFRSYEFAWEDVFELELVRSRAMWNQEFTTGEPGSLLVVTTLDSGERVCKLAATFLSGAERYPEQAVRLERLRAMRKAYSTREW